MKRKDDIKIVLREKNFIENLYEKYKNFLVFLVAEMLFLIPLWLRHISNKSLFPSISKAMLYEFFMINSFGVRARAYRIIQHYLMTNFELRLFLFYLLFSSLIVGFVIEILKRMKMNTWFALIIPTNPLILKYLLIPSTTTFSLFFLIIFIYPFFLIMAHIKKITKFLSARHISFSAFFITTLFILFYPLIFGFALDYFSLILFIVIVASSIKYFKTQKQTMKVFTLIVLILFIILDLRYYGIDQYTKVNLLSFDLIKDYVSKLYQRYIRIYDEVNIKTFVYTYDNSLFSNMINKANYYLRKLFKVYVNDAYATNVGKHIVKMYNLLSTIMLLYTTILIFPGIIYFLFVFIGLFCSRYKFRTLLIFLFMTLLVFVDLHFMIVFGLFTSFLFLLGLKRILNLEMDQFNEITKMLIIALFIFNYISLLENYLQMQPNNVDVWVYNEKGDLILSNFDLSFEFSSKNYFISNNFNDFYKKVYVYATLFTIDNPINLKALMKQNHIDSLVLIDHPFSEHSSINIIKNAIWMESIRNLLNTLKKLDAKKINEKDLLDAIS